VRLFGTGHFALDTYAAEIAAAIRDFLPLWSVCTVLFGEPSLPEQRACPDRD
jgi:hypothetical protein